MIFALTVGNTCAAAAQNSVQGIPNAVQGFSQNRDQPVRIEAASLVMKNKIKEATFTGGVKVVQGDTTMKSKTLVALYDKAGSIPSATPGPDGSTSIRRLEAKGNVVVTQKDQVATGETAVFDARTNLITMLGGVILTQCKSVMRGDRLLVDMTTGVSRIESDSGKVQVLIDQSSGSGCGTPPALPGPSVTGSKRK